MRTNVAYWHKLTVAAMQRRSGEIALKSSDAAAANPQQADTTRLEPSTVAPLIHR
jgi:hypothetical protein